MAIFSLTNASVLVGVADLTSHTNDITVDASVVDLDATTFGSSGWVSKLAGLRSAKLDLKGFYEAGTAGLPDDQLYADVGVSGVVVTTVPQGYTDGNVAYFGSFMPPTHKVAGKVGDILGFETSAVADAPLIRGQLANSATRTATGTGTALNLGAVGATQRVYAALHVLTVSGTTPSLTVTVQSDTSSSFPSPTTVATFTAATAATSQIVKGSVGVNSDTYYRFSWTITGTTPSFAFYGAVGIA